MYIITLLIYKIRFLYLSLTDAIKNVDYTNFIDKHKLNSSILTLFQNLQQALGRRTPPSRLKENLNLYRYLMHGKDIKDSRALPYIIYPEKYIILIIVQIGIPIIIELFQ